MKIDRKDFYTIKYYKDNRFTGSCGDTRFLVERCELPAEEVAPKDGGAANAEAPKSEVAKSEAAEPPKPIVKLTASVWPGPYCYEKTEPDKIIREYFDFSDAGLDAAVAWLEQK